MLAIKPQCSSGGADLAAGGEGDAGRLDPRGKDDRQPDGAPARARAVVRAMPNTPAAIGRGVTGGLCDPEVSAEQTPLGREPARAVGRFYWLESRARYSTPSPRSRAAGRPIFCAVRGDGSAGEKLGLPAALAMSLARGTVEGWGKTPRREPDARLP